MRRLSCLICVLAIGCNGSENDAEGPTDELGEGEPTGNDDPTSNDSGEPDGPCSAFAPGDDFIACAATYLSGGGDDGPAALAFASDGTLLYAGTLIGSDLGLTPTSLLGGGDGALVRVSNDGRSLVSLTRIGGSLTGVATQASGEIVVAGDFGVALLDASATTLLWSRSLAATPSRLALGHAGTIALLVDDGVELFDGAGNPLASVAVGGGTKHDLVLDDASGTVIVTGFEQDDGPPCTQLQIPFIRAFDLAGAPKWTAYDWTKDEVGAADQCADTRGMALALGGDGKLYYAGESHGGNTVHHRMPNDLASDAPNVAFDVYNDPYDLNGAAPITYYARFDPATGVLELGQFLVTRLSDGKGNAARPVAIAATESGHVMVTGATACCVERGDHKTNLGAPAFGDYLGGGFLLVVSPDFEERLSWTSFRGTTGDGDTGVRLAIGPEYGALIVDQQHDEGTETRGLWTFAAIQAEPGGGKRDGWLGVFPMPE